MSRYSRKCFFRELAWTIRHPRRDDMFEMAYATKIYARDLVRPFKEPFWFAAKVWAYKDLLWNDRDWDFSYLLAFMERKLRRMADEARDHGYHTSSDRNARRMLIASELCRRIREDDYESAGMAQLTELFGEIQMSARPTDNPRAAELIIQRSGAINEKEKARELGTSRRIWESAERRKKNEIEYLGILFNKYLLGWWE